MPIPAAAPGGGGAPGPHMAGFKANVRINEKVHENIAVGHNRVKVQGSGIPAISVEWQTNPKPISVARVVRIALVTWCAVGPWLRTAVNTRL